MLCEIAEVKMNLIQLTLISIFIFALIKFLGVYQEWKFRKDVVESLKNIEQLLSNSTTIEWYIEQLKDQDIDNWTAWTRFNAANSALGNKSELLYIAGDILSKKNKQD